MLYEVITDSNRQDVRQQGYKPDAMGHEHDGQYQVNEDQRQARNNFV